MAKISMELLKELREKTQVGMMDCKKALEETGGDLDKAIEILRKKGAAVAAKRADNATDNGRIEAYIADNSKSGSLVEIACETDFSANNENMKKFALHVAQEANKAQTNDPKKLVEENKEINDHFNELLAKITEKILVNKIATFTVETHGIVNHYIHPGATIGALIEFTTEKEASARGG